MRRLSSDHDGPDHDHDHGLYRDHGHDEPGPASLLQQR
jgi:hypothetical protein